MCGIFAYTGSRNAGEILLDGLTSLEYRGYDSAGIYTPESGGVKAVGAVSHLRRKMPPGFFGTSGIAHLRWATHGEPTEINAHPHKDCTGDVWVVHNGIIEKKQKTIERYKRHHKINTPSSPHTNTPSGRRGSTFRWSVGPRRISRRGGRPIPS